MLDAGSSARSERPCWQEEYTPPDAPAAALSEDTNAFKAGFGRGSGAVAGPVVAVVSRAAQRAAGPLYTRPLLSST